MCTLFAFSICRKTSFLIYGETVISAGEGTQQGLVPEVFLVFAKTMQVLVNDIQSKIIELYYDDGSLADDYKIVLQDFKRLRALKKSWFECNFC